MKLNRIYILIYKYTEEETGMRREQRLYFSKYDTATHNDYILREIHKQEGYNSLIVSKPLY